MQTSYSADRRRTSLRLRSLLLLSIVILLAFPLLALAQTSTPGLANDFEIDGNLIANAPGGIIGLGDDWLDGLPGPGTGVLLPDALGTPKNPTFTFHIIDLIENDDMDIFGKGNKVFHDPNNYQWKTGSVPPKNDIQNGLIHFSKDGSGNNWISVAGDRRTTNGSSYIDFEFLQNRLTMNGDGTFTSLGPDGGRTVGDLLLTIELTKGGGLAQFFAQQWMSDGAGGYTYASIPFPVGGAFVAASADSQVVTTYDAFGSNMYTINQFGEAAVNMNALLPNFGVCYGVATLFVRTKSSASSDAELKDFIEPFQIDWCLDEEPPTITCPADLSVPCDASVDPGIVGYADGTDNCDDDLNIVYADSIAPGSCPQEYTIHRRWTATDECGNSASCTQLISVYDDTPPEVASGPGPETVQCIGDIPSPNISLISATDNCGAVTVTHVGDVSDGGSCPEVFTRTYRVEDECSNFVEFDQLITVHDTTVPAITAPDDVILQCDEEIPPADINDVTASDNCGSVTVTHVSDVSDNASCPETITRTYRATDGCGNTTDDVQIITIDDTTAPGISGPGNITIQCDEEIPAADIGLITASDNCGSVVISHVGDQSDSQSCPETITRTYRATDDCGNTADHIQLIIIEDNTAPSITCPNDVTVECAGQVPAADINSVTASDNCGDATVTHIGDVPDGNTCPQRITRTYRATDACGNFTECVQIITIDDRTDPVINGPDDITVQCMNEIPAADILDISAGDLCGGVSVEHIGDSYDGGGCPEVITRTYRATDACGNTTDFIQTITVNDTTPPTVSSGPGPVTVDCYGDIPPANIGLIVASDNCSEINVIHVGDVSDGNTCPEVITRTYQVIDECLNVTDFVQIITVDDDTPPVFTYCPPDDSLECPVGWGFGQPVATDNCDPNPFIYIVSTDSVIAPEGWTIRLTRVWQAVDACGNTSATCTQVLTIHCEAQSFCTLTQGFWGNGGGNFNGAGTLEIIRNLLSSSPLVVGKEGRSLTFPYEAAHCIIVRLPGGKTATSLPPIGDAVVSAATCLTPISIPLNSSLRYENVLLSQTIALTLNTRLSVWLSLFPLTEQFCTRRALPGPDGLLGTEDDVIDFSAPIRTFYIPADVLDALDTLGLPRAVSGLLELANRALANWDTGGASFSQINDAVDAINRGFNECAVIYECPSTGGKVSGDDILTRSDQNESMEAISNLPKQFQLDQNYPNPFNPNTRIILGVPEAASWSLAIYDVTGRLIKKFDGSTGGPRFVTIEWDGTNQSGIPVASGVYLYRANAGDFTAVKKMILLK
jgi:hypothetical protein